MPAVTRITSSAGLLPAHLLEIHLDCLGSECEVFCLYAGTPARLVHVGVDGTSQEAIRLSLAEALFTEHGVEALNAIIVADWLIADAQRLGLTIRTRERPVAKSHRRAPRDGRPARPR